VGFVAGAWLVKRREGKGREGKGEEGRMEHGWKQEQTYATGLEMTLRPPGEPKVDMVMNGCDNAV